MKVYVYSEYGMKFIETIEIKEIRTNEHAYVMFTDKTVLPILFISNFYCGNLFSFKKITESEKKKLFNYKEKEYDE